MPANVGAVHKGQYRIRCQLLAVIDDDRLRPAEVAMMASNSCATLASDNGMSGTSARLWRVQSSTTPRTRNRRPSVIRANTESTLRRWFRASAAPIGLGIA